jgi:hypothetical protein
MSSANAEDYPRLDALLGGWFHQDFDIEGDSLEDIIAAYKAATPADERSGVKAEVARFLQQCDVNGTDVAEEIMTIFRPGVDPSAWAMSARQWLLRICDLV